MIHAAIWVLIIAVMLSCFFAACSSAMRTFSRARLVDILEERGRTDRLEPFLGNSAKLMLMAGTFRAGLNLIVLLSVLSLFEHARWVEDPVYQLLLKYAVALALAAGLISVFGVAIPYSLARHHAERLLARSMPILEVCLQIFRPVANVLHVFDPIVRRVVGAEVTTGSADERLTEEILSVVEDHDTEDVVDEEQKEMLEGVIELRSTTAEQIMTPRTDIKGIEAPATLEQVKDAVLDLGYSRIPVYRENLDDIVGILYAKDLIQYLGNGRTFDLESLSREAYMVPESKPVGDLLTELKARKVHIAIVLDEYGGTAGLLTIEDIIEEIVGEIADEYEPTDELASIEKINDSTIEVDARLRVNDVNDELDLELPEDDDYDTVGGFVISRLGHIPATGENFAYENMTITVAAAEKTRVARVRIETTN